MSETDPLLVPRILASVAVDASLALICGLLLALVWLRRIAARGILRVAALGWPAVTLLLALCAQMWLLSATMVSSMNLHLVWAAMPDVLAMRAGKRAEWTLGLAFLLTCWALVKIKDSFKIAGCAALLFLCLLLRSATGHAAVDGDFSLAEFLQVMHLTSMALWSGGVLISGLIVFPRLVRDGNQRLREYVGALSTVSTWAVAAVALSGVLKGWRALDGHVTLLEASPWGWVLTWKVLFVGVALALGAANRFLVMPREPWTELETRRSMRFVKAEAYAMAAIVALSAWVASLPPPGE